jgi:hypothetical protein
MEIETSERTTVGCSFFSVKKTFETQRNELRRKPLKHRGTEAAEDTQRKSKMGVVRRPHALSCILKIAGNTLDCRERRETPLCESKAIPLWIYLTPRFRFPLRILCCLCSSVFQRFSLQLVALCFKGFGCSYVTRCFKGFVLPRASVAGPNLPASAFASSKSRAELRPAQSTFPSLLPGGA